MHIELLLVLGTLISQWWTSSTMEILCLFLCDMVSMLIMYKIRVKWDLPTPFWIFLSIILPTHGQQAADGQNHETYQHGPWQETWQKSTNSSCSSLNHNVNPPKHKTQPNIRLWILQREIADFPQSVVRTAGIIWWCFGPIEWGYICGPKISSRTSRHAWCTNSYEILPQWICSHQIKYKERKDVNDMTNRNRS